MAGSGAWSPRGIWESALRPAIFLVTAVLLLGCSRSEQRPPASSGKPGAAAPAAQNLQAPAGNGEPAVSQVQEALASDTIEHTVLLGETLATIAGQYGTTVQDLVAANQITDPNILLPGDILRIPSTAQPAVDFDQLASAAGTSLIGDHELVYGPAARDFDLQDFLQSYDGALAAYQEEVEGRLLDGAGIVQLVADRYQVNPRLLLALLEYNAGWVTGQPVATTDYMMGKQQEGLEGLYKQLSWAANLLNFGFYGRAEGGLSTYTLGETEITIPPHISYGTSGLYYYLAARDDVTVQRWLADTGTSGFLATYRQLFGDIADRDSGPLLPDNLQQPPLLLPWEPGITWNFSGGPHGGWNSGSAWAALDFVPPDVEYGCAPSGSWVTAVADGVIARSDFGAVVLDLDGDGYAGTGWAVLYMHLDNNERVAAGTRVAAGDRLGHPGCEGGFSNGTHLHLARTYNGRWISADGDIPFNLAGWVSGGVGSEYNGWLQRDGETRTADVYATDDNAITAD